MRKAQKDPQGWLTRLVRKMMDDLRAEDIWSRQAILTSQGISDAFCVQIRAKLLEMSPATRGEIADMGKSYANTVADSLACGAYVVSHKSGRDIVMAVAQATVIAKMYDLLCEEATDLSRHEEKDSTQEMHDVTGRGSIGHGRPPWSQSM